MGIIGKVSPHAVKNKDQVYPDIKSIPYSFVAMFIGFIDGDEYISILKTKKIFIGIRLEIRLYLKDLSILEYFKSILKIGKIYEYPKHNVCVYIINRTDLQSFIFPLLFYNNIFFLTNVRNIQFNKAIYILYYDIKLNNDIPLYIPHFSNYITQINYPILLIPNDYVNLSYFNN
jgi:hypothetical protein